MDAEKITAAIRRVRVVPVKEIKVLAISASPRRDGNTDNYLSQALEILNKSEIAAEVTKYSFFGKRFGACIGCLRCYENGGSCILKDDFEELRKLWLEADCIIYCLPVYVVGIPGQLKCFIDRLHNATGHYFPIRSPRHLKVIACLTQGCELFGGQELASVDIMKHAALINSVYIAPDGSYTAASAWCGGMEKDRIVSQSESGNKDYDISLKCAQCAVKRAVELAAVIKTGMEGMQPVLSQDPRYKPYLERIGNGKE